MMKVVDGGGGGGGGGGDDGGNGYGVGDVIQVSEGYIAVLEEPRMSRPQGGERPTTRRTRHWLFHVFGPLGRQRQSGTCQQLRQQGKIPQQTRPMEFPGLALFSLSPARTNVAETK